jgi:hypothetical protein
MNRIQPHLLATLLGLALAGSAPGQDNPAKATAEGDGPAAAAAAAAQQPSVLKPEDLKWNKDLKWISFIVDDGRIQSQRDYFGAVSTADFQALTGGTAKGMVRVQQVFYYNGATRSFSRFDASAGGSLPLLSKNGYFRPDSIMRIVELNEKFVESLAVRSFLNVAGE